MFSISVNKMSDKQRRAWEMRYCHGWRIRRVALELGTTAGAVSRLLQRAMLRAGLPKRRYVRIMRTKPLLARALHLSGVRGY